MIHCGEQGHVLFFSLVHSFRIDSGIFLNMPTFAFILHTFSYAMHTVHPCIRISFYGDDAVQSSSGFISNAITFKQEQHEVVA